MEAEGSYHEERHGAPPVDGAVLDVGLVGEVVRRLDGNLHPLNGQESCQVSRVGGDDDQGEGPPGGKKKKTKGAGGGKGSRFMKFVDTFIDL